MSKIRIRQRLALLGCGGFLASASLTGCGAMGADNPQNFYVQDIGGAHCIVFIGDNSRAAMQCDFRGAR